MERLLGWKFWGGVVAAYSASLGWLFNNMQALLDRAQPYVPTQEIDPGVAIAVLSDWAPAILVALLTLGLACWRLLWRVPFLGPWLSGNLFPDLNGEWEVTLKSNWPMIQAMMQAARDDRPAFDPEKADTILGDVKLRARIRQGWLGVSMTMSAPDGKGPIDQSATLAFDLVSAKGGGNPQIAYVYDQKNKSEGRASTDPDQFLGGALLDVLEDGKRMKGRYFTARSWIKGLNTAGEIEMVKIG